MKNIEAPPAPAAYSLKTHQDLDVLLRYIGNARYVLLGEASHMSIIHGVRPSANGLLKKRGSHLSRWKAIGPIAIR